MPEKNGSQPASTTPFDRFRAFTSKLMKVPKAEIDEQERKYQRAKKRRQKRKSG